MGSGAAGVGFVVTATVGDYPTEWFDQTGQRRLALFTCTGLTGNRFTTTTAIFATPTT